MRQGTGREPIVNQVDRSTWKGNAARGFGEQISSNLFKGKVLLPFMTTERNGCSEEREADRKGNDILAALTQPMTATQISRRLEVSLERCCGELLKHYSRRLVQCLNPSATRNRLYWLTSTGKKHQRWLASERVSHDFPEIDWALYASVCFSHRSEVVRTLAFAMQPSQIKRRAAFHTPGLRMSANNVRDVIRYLRDNSIVQSVKVKKKAHLRYELTELGLHMRRLLLQAGRRQ